MYTDHGKEDAKLRAHIDIVSISKDKAFATFLLAGENYCDLLGRDRQNWKVNAVELIKTAPRTRLSQTWKSDTCDFTLLQIKLNLQQNIHYTELSLLCPVMIH